MRAVARQTKAMKVRLASAGLLMVLLIQVVPAPYRIETRGAEADQSIDSNPDVPAAVKAVIRRACMNCHSEQTEVPWYGHVAPVSWLLARDVEKARAAVNLSRWGGIRPSLRAALAAIACEDVRIGRMPPASYLLMHPEARLSQADVDALCKWSKDLMSRARLSRRH